LGERGTWARGEVGVTREERPHGHPHATLHDQLPGLTAHWFVVDASGHATPEISNICEPDPISCGICGRPLLQGETLRRWCVKVTYPAHNAGPALHSICPLHCNEPIHRD
jgi:hypothetical protein